MTNEILSQLTFGESIAELEATQLRNYFIYTEYWKNIRSGKNDIIYGAKGSGKSAIYTSLVNEKEELFSSGILLASAENPSGNTAFSTLKIDPPTNQIEFTRLWKLYFLVIAAEAMKDLSLHDQFIKEVQNILEDCKLIPAQKKLASMLRSCLDFIKKIGNVGEISTTAEFDTISGLYKGQKVSICFHEPSESDFKKGILPIEYVYSRLCESLKRNNITLWIVVDRLDVAFQESEELESNAIKALFKTYLDLIPNVEIKIKIFLRDDIWKKITSGGFREASHITKYELINWNKESILNLIIRRLLENQILIDKFNIDRAKILSSLEEQEKCFYRFFPAQVDIGLKKSKTFEWILSHTKDGKSIYAPREIIQLLNQARALEVKRLENGINDLEGEQIISRTALKEAFNIVSKQRMEQTIYAEYPSLKRPIEKLKNDKADHSFDTFKQKWETTESETEDLIRQLCEIGFLEERGTYPRLKFKIPFIYRPYLGIIQGNS